MRFSQQGIINADPKNRLGKMAAMTAEELGGKKDVVTISVDELAMEGKKNFLSSPAFIHKNGHFTKTGSGQA
jgi:hypothetical protein